MCRCIQREFTAPSLRDITGSPSASHRSSLGNGAHVMWGNAPYANAVQRPAEKPPLAASALTGHLCRFSSLRSWALRLQAFTCGVHDLFSCLRGSWRQPLALHGRVRMASGLEGNLAQIWGVCCCWCCVAAAAVTRPADPSVRACCSVPLPPDRPACRGSAHRAHREHQEGPDVQRVRDAQLRGQGTPRR